MAFIFSKLAAQPVALGVPEGKTSAAKVLQVPMIGWNNPSDTYILDPTQSNQLLEFQNIQGVFFISTSNAANQMAISGTNFLVHFNPQTQGFIPLLCGDRPVFTFTYLGTNAGDGALQVWLVNFQVPPFQFSLVP